MASLFQPTSSTTSCRKQRKSKDDKQRRNRRFPALFPTGGYLPQNLRVSDDDGSTESIRDDEEDRNNDDDDTRSRRSFLSGIFARGGSLRSLTSTKSFRRRIKSPSSSPSTPSQKKSPTRNLTLTLTLTSSSCSQSNNDNDSRTQELSPCVTLKKQLINDKTEEEESSSLMGDDVPEANHLEDWQDEPPHSDFVPPEFIVIETMTTDSDEAAWMTEI